MSIVSWLLIAVAVIIVMAIVALVTRSRRSATSATDEAVPASEDAAVPASEDAAVPDDAADGRAPEPAGEATPDDPTLTDGHDEDLFTHGSGPADTGGAGAPTSADVPEPRTSDPATNGAVASGGTDPAPVPATQRWDPVAPGPIPDTTAEPDAEGSEVTARGADTASSGPPSHALGAPVAERPNTTATSTPPAGTSRTATPTTGRAGTSGAVPSLSVADGDPLWTVSAEEMARAEPSSGSAMASLDSGLIGPAGPATSSAGSSPDTSPSGAGPYPGAVRAPADGSEPPADHPVKVHTGSGRYHTADSPYYVRTRADLYFVGADEAEAAGFVAWNSRPGGGS